MGKGDFPKNTRYCNLVVGEWMPEKGKVKWVYCSTHLGFDKKYWAQLNERINKIFISMEIASSEITYFYIWFLEYDTRKMNIRSKGSRKISPPYAQYWLRFNCPILFYIDSKMQRSWRRPVSQTASLPQQNTID